MRRLEGYENVDSVLSQLADLHRQLASMFSTAGESHSSQRQKLLLDYLADHHSKRAIALEDYRKDAPPSLKNNWFQIPFPESMQTFIADVRLSEEATADEITAVLSRIDDFLSRLLNYIRDRADTTNVKDLFEDLLSIEVRERALRSRALSSFTQI